MWLRKCTYRIFILGVRKKHQHLAGQICSKNECGKYEVGKKDYIAISAKSKLFQKIKFQNLTLTPCRSFTIKCS